MARSQAQQVETVEVKTPNQQAAAHAANAGELAQMVKENNKKARTRAQSRSSTGEPVSGKAVIDLEEQAKARASVEAKAIVTDMFKALSKEGNIWHPFYMRVLEARELVREAFVVQLRDARKAYNETLAKAGENHITRTIPATTYVRISELSTFAKACNKGLSAAKIGELIEVDGKPLKPAQATIYQLYAAARQHLGGGKKEKAPLSEGLSPEVQFQLAIARAVARGELAAGFLTHRWMANHAAKAVDDMGIKPKSFDKDAAMALARELSKVPKAA